MAVPKPNIPAPNGPSSGRLPSRAARILALVLQDIARLKRPVTAAAAVATLTSLLSPFGLNVGPDGTTITGALVAIGVAVGYLEHLKGAA